MEHKLQSINNSPSMVGFLLLCLLFYSSFNTFAQSAKVNKVWLEHGTIKNGDKGMTIHADIDVKGMKGKKIEGIAYFYNSEKKKLMGGVSGYKTRTGQVCASDYATPSYTDSHFSDFDIFIPYESLPLLSGKHTYYILVDFLDAESDDFLSDNRNYVSFTGTGGGQRSSPRRDYSVEEEDDDNTVECGVCRGQGEYKCFVCVNGYVINILNPITGAYSRDLCTFCDGTGFQDCSFCRGTGRIKKTKNSNGNSGIMMGGASGGMYGGMPDNSGSNSSSGSTYQTCPSCGGSGSCTGCGGRGKYWVDSGLYTGSGSRTQVDCGSCGGSGRCRVCYGKGRL